VLFTLICGLPIACFPDVSHRYDQGTNTVDIIGIDDILVD
jgi:hypothetical protein